MSDRFVSHASRWLLRVEGGWSANTRDPGGLTRYGISSRAHPDVNLETLTPAGALEIYRRDYWDPRLPPGLDVAVLDARVQHGRKTGVRMLQRILRVRPDGEIGELETLPAAAACDVGKVLEALSLARLSLYSSLDTWDEFGAGWSRRLLLLPRAAL